MRKPIVEQAFYFKDGSHFIVEVHFNIIEKEEKYSGFYIANSRSAARALVSAFGYSDIEVDNNGVNWIDRIDGGGDYHGC